MFWTVFTSVNYKFGYGFEEKLFVIRYLTYHLRWSMEDKQINKQTNKPQQCRQTAQHRSFSGSNAKEVVFILIWMQVRGERAFKG